MANITYFHKLHAKNFANKKIECFGGESIHKVF